MVNFITDRLIPALAGVLVLMLACMVACVCTAIYGGWEWALAVERAMDWIVGIGFVTAAALAITCLGMFLGMIVEDQWLKAVVRSNPYLLLEQEKEMWRTSYRETCKAYAKALSKMDELRKTVTKVEAELERLEALVPMTETEAAALDADIENGRDMLVTYLAPCKRA